MYENSNVTLFERKFQCLDINECDVGMDNCDEERGICNNTDGSYTCSCELGFSGDGINCSGMFL